MTKLSRATYFLVLSFSVLAPVPISTPPVQSSPASLCTAVTALHQTVLSNTTSPLGCPVKLLPQAAPTQVIESNSIELPSKTKIKYKICNKTESSKQTIVLVHGLHSDGNTWEKKNTFQELCKNYRVILYDQRGFGESRAPDKIYTLKQLAIDLGELLDHLLEKDTKVHLIAHSYGALVGMQFAGQTPQRVKSLTLEDQVTFSNPALPAGFEVDYLKRASQLPHSFADKSDLIQKLSSLEFIGKKSAERFAADPEKVTNTAGKPIQLNFDVHAGESFRLAAMFTDLTPAITQVEANKIPSLIIKTKYDSKVAMNKDLEHYRTRGGSAQLIEIDTKEHNIHKNKPDEFLKAVKDFIETVK